MIATRRVLVLGAVVLACCGESGGGTGGFVVVVSLPDAIVDVAPRLEVASCEELVAGVDERRAAWEAAQPASYGFSVARQAGRCQWVSSFGVWRQGERLALEVLGNRYGMCDWAVWGEDVSALFGLLQGDCRFAEEDCGDFPLDEVLTAEFEPTFHYPSSISLDCPLMVDEERIVEVSELRLASDDCTLVHDPAQPWCGREQGCVRADCEGERCPPADPRVATSLAEAQACERDADCTVIADPVVEWDSEPLAVNRTVAAGELGRTWRGQWLERRCVLRDGYRPYDRDHPWHRWEADDAPEEMASCVDGACTIAPEYMPDEFRCYGGTIFRGTPVADGAAVCRHQPDCTVPNASEPPPHQGCPATCWCLCYKQHCYRHQCTGIGCGDQPPVWQ